jgi:hypothetical protein
MKRVAVPLVIAASILVSDRARADDKADCIAAFDSAQTALADGKVQQAIANFAACSRDVCPQSLQKRCVDKATESATLLPSVVLSATDAGNNAVVDVKVTVDGSLVATLLDGRTVPLDPGLHTFRFETAGFPAVERQIAIKEGQKGQSVAVQFAPTAPAVTAVTPVVAAPVPLATTEPPPATDRHAPWTTMRWAGIGVGAAGVVGIGVGSVFGAMAFSKWSDAKAQCGVSCAPSSPANDAKRTGETDGDISTAAFVAGGVLAAGGLVLFLVAPARTASATALVTPTPGGLQVVGRF